MASVTTLTTTRTIYRQELRSTLANPTIVLIGLTQPLLYLLLFGPLLQPLARSLGSDNAYTVLVPGLMVQLGLFSTGFAGFALVGSIRDGVLEGERVTPASRSGLLLGRLLRDLTQLGTQYVLLLGAAALLGLRVPWWGVVFGAGMTLLLGGTMASLSYGLALRLQSEMALSSLMNTVLLPVLLLSGILLPMSIGPRWLRTISSAIPTTHVVEAVRQAFAGHVGHELVVGAALAVAMFLLAMLWGERAFQSES